MLSALSRLPICPDLSQTRPHLVKTYGLFITPSSALATTSSEWPSPYTAAVSIQLMPRSSPSRIVAMLSVSSWAPQANAQPPPPMAHAPKPIGVICRSELPSRRVCILTSYHVPYATHRIDQRGRPHAPIARTRAAPEGSRRGGLGREHARSPARRHLHRAGDAPHRQAAERT